MFVADGDRKDDKLVTPAATFKDCIAAVAWQTSPLSIKIILSDLSALLSSVLITWLQISPLWEKPRSSSSS